MQRVQRFDEIIAKTSSLSRQNAMLHPKLIECGLCLVH